jgi:quercetin dioxygenase-like cupin family protein
MKDFASRGDQPGDTMFKIEEKDQHKVDVFDGVKRITLACGKDILMAKFVYKNGSSVPPHEHSYEQVTTVLEGEQKIIIRSDEGRKEFVVKAGESYVVPANYKHEQISLKETVTIDVWSLAP